jgi:HD-GYP domain-containing protein (c-di-GMP phosphodiesterase class II)
MISDRPYRKGLSVETARSELARNLGSQFWAEAGEALLTVLSGGPDAA